MVVVSGRVSIRSAQRLRPSADGPFQPASLSFLHAPDPSLTHSFVSSMSLFNLTRLHNKIVLITGASAGIGKVWLCRPLSQHLHAHRSYCRLPLFSLQRIVVVHEDISLSRDLTPIQAGSNIVLVARRPDALKETVAACEAAHKASGVQAGGKVHPIDTRSNSPSYPLPQFTSVQVDVSKKEQVS